MWSPRVLVFLQIAGVLLALVTLAFYPPAEGKVILIPLTAAAAARIAPLALSAGAALVGDGPLHGSLVVSGERQRLAAAFAQTHILILAAPPAACGASTSARA